MVAHVFNPSTWEADADGFLSSRPAWAIQRDPVSKKKKKKKKLLFDYIVYTMGYTCILTE